MRRIQLVALAALIAACGRSPEPPGAEGEAQAKAQAGAEEKAQAGAEEKAQAGAEEKAEADAEEKAEAEAAEEKAEEKAEADAEEKVEADAEEKAEAAADGLPWIHDDWDAARAEAKRRGVPLVVDMWAPWCHTCLSMQHFVLSDPSVATLAEHFVWLAVDTDREINAEVVAALPIKAWPTYFVVDPTTGAVEARLVGSATARDFRTWLEGAHRIHLASRGDAKLAAGSPLIDVREGDRAAVEGRHADAVAAYDRALAGSLGELRPDVLVSAIDARRLAGDKAGCVRFGLDHLAEASATKTAKAADFAAYALWCAQEQGLDPALVKAVREAVVATDSPVRKVVLDPKAPLSDDDRAEGLRILREAYDALGDYDMGKALAERQLAVVKRAIAAAPDARAAMTFNWPVAEVHVRLERPADAIPYLERSVAALPEEYDPPYRLAWVLLQANRADEAVAPAERALTLAYGPRKARIYGVLAEIHRVRGDRAAQRQAWADAVALWESLPAAQQNAAALADAREALAALPPDR